MKHTLEEEGAVEANALGGVRFFDGCTVGGGVDGIVLGLGGFRGWHFFVCKTTKSVTERTGRGQRKRDGLNV